MFGGKPIPTFCDGKKLVPAVLTAEVIRQYAAFNGESPVLSRFTHDTPPPRAPVNVTRVKVMDWLTHASEIEKFRLRIVHGVFRLRVLTIV